MALMQLEPMSNPTIVFPDPNIAIPPCLMSVFGFLHLTYAGRLRRSWPFLGNAHVHGALLFHPLVQNRLLELPAVPELEGRDFFFRHVLVERVRTDPQVLRSLSNVHYLTRICCHKRKPFHSGFSASPGLWTILCLLGGKTSGRSELYPA